MLCCVVIVISPNKFVEPVPAETATAVVATAVTVSVPVAMARPCQWQAIVRMRYLANTSQRDSASRVASTYNVADRRKAGDRRRDKWRFLAIDYFKHKIYFNRSIRNFQLSRSKECSCRERPIQRSRQLDGA